MSRAPELCKLVLHAQPEENRVGAYGKAPLAKTGRPLIYWPSPEHIEKMASAVASGSPTLA